MIQPNELMFPPVNINWKDLNCLRKQEANEISGAKRRQTTCCDVKHFKRKASLMRL